MISKTPYKVPIDFINEAAKSIPSKDFKFSLNEPTGNFFYDPWKLKDEFIGTVWEKIYNSLPMEKGEARIIKLESGKSYVSHADIDDRWHLHIHGERCFLNDLDDLKMYPLMLDGVWYDMNAGKRHTASNFGNRDRYQLVIRHLLKKNRIVDPVNINLENKENINVDDARFIFDDIISPWLNVANKSGNISNFSYKNNKVSFVISEKVLNNFNSILPKEFKIL